MWTARAHIFPEQGSVSDTTGVHALRLFFSCCNRSGYILGVQFIHTDPFTNNEFQLLSYLHSVAVFFRPAHGTYRLHLPNLQGASQQPDLHHESRWDGVSQDDMAG